LIDLIRARGRWPVALFLVGHRVLTKLRDRNHTVIDGNPEGSHDRGFDVADHLLRRLGWQRQDVNLLDSAIIGDDNPCGFDVRHLREREFNLGYGCRGDCVFHSGPPGSSCGPTDAAMVT